MTTRHRKKWSCVNAAIMCSYPCPQRSELCKGMPVQGCNAVAKKRDKVGGKNAPITLLETCTPICWRTAFAPVRVQMRSLDAQVCRDDCPGRSGETPKNIDLLDELDWTWAPAHMRVVDLSHKGDIGSVTRVLILETELFVARSPA